MRRTILLADPDDDARAELAQALVAEGFAILEARDGDDTLEVFTRNPIDLVVLELDLPDAGGLDVCRSLRERWPVPIVILSSRQSDIDKIVALEVGADDYVTTPYSFRELLARIRALLRRAEAGGRIEHDRAGRQPTGLQMVRLGRVWVDARGHRLMRDGAALRVTPKAFQLLVFLLRNPGQVFSREQLIERVWGYDYVGETRTVNVHVSWLRSQIEEDPSEPAFLQTVRGVGYVLRLDEPRSERASFGSVSPIEGVAMATIATNGKQREAAAHRD